MVESQLEVCFALYFEAVSLDELVMGQVCELVHVQIIPTEILYIEVLCIVSENHPVVFSEHSLSSLQLLLVPVYPHITSHEVVPQIVYHRLRSHQAYLLPLV